MRSLSSPCAPLCFSSVLPSVPYLPLPLRAVSAPGHTRPRLSRSPCPRRTLSGRGPQPPWAPCTQPWPPTSSARVTDLEAHPRGPAPSCPTPPPAPTVRQGSPAPGTYPDPIRLTGRHGSTPAGTLARQPRTAVAGSHWPRGRAAFLLSCPASPRPGPPTTGAPGSRLPPAPCPRACSPSAALSVLRPRMAAAAPSATTPPQSPPPPASASGSCASRPWRPPPPPHPSASSPSGAPTSSRYVPCAPPSHRPGRRHWRGRARPPAPYREGAGQSHGCGAAAARVSKTPSTQTHAASLGSFPVPSCTPRLF